MTAEHEPIDYEQRAVDYLDRANRCSSGIEVIKAHLSAAATYASLHASRAVANQVNAALTVAKQNAEMCQLLSTAPAPNFPVVEPPTEQDVKHG